MPSNQLSLTLELKGKDSTQAALSKARAGVQSISEQLSRARVQFLAFQASMLSMGRIAALANLADQVQQVNARLRLATSSAQEFAAAQALAYRVAAQTGAGYEAVSTLYARLAQAAGGLGLTQAQVARTTEATALALKVSGASAGESAAVITQLSQALGAGVLRGDEFNSIMENGGRLAQALVDGLGLPVGRLRELAEAGLLTTDVVVRALESQSGKLKAEAAAMPVTIGQALSQVRDEFGRTIDRFNQTTGATSAVSSALTALARNMDAVLGGVAVAAVGALTAATVRGGQAAVAYVQQQLAKIAADRQAALAAQAVAANEVAKAQAMLAAAQAAVASSSGMARLTVVQTQLVPAQQRLAAAQTALNAAQAAGSVTARALSLAMAALGGPVGVILTLLTAGATAWAIWGNRASEAGEKAKAAADKARAAIEQANAARDRLEREQKYGAGDAGTLREGIAAAGGEIAAKTQALIAAQRDAERARQQTLYAREGSELAAVAAYQRQLDKIKQLRAEIATLQRDREANLKKLRELETGAAGDAAALGREVLGKGFDQYLDQYRKKLDPLAAALKELRAQAQKAGIALESEQFKKAEALVRAAFAKDGAPRQSASLAIDKADTEAALALLKDGLRRQQTALDAALEDRLISVRDYYARKTALEQQEIDAEIARTQQALARSRQVAAGGNSEEERLRGKAEVARLEAELIALNNKRADVEQSNARAAAKAERELADALAAAREELARLTGTDTAQDRRAAIERSYRDLRARLLAESDADGVSIIDRLIDVKAALANLDAIEAQWRQVTERLRNAQEGIQIQQQAGLLTEAQARQQIVALQRESAAEMQRLLPALEQAAQAIGPEAVLRVAAWRNELTRTRLVTDELAPVWNRIGEAFGQAVQGIVSGAQSLREALSNIFRSIADAFLQEMVLKPFQQWVAMQARMLAVKLGLLQQEQAAETAAAAQSVATKQAEAAAKVSANAAEAGAGAAASQAAIPVVGPGLAIAAMVAMVAAVMALLGNIKKFAAGGYVTGPGSATSDSIPARLSAGEYVVRAAAVQRVGVAFLDAINGLRTPPTWDGQRLAFAAGGLVPPVSAPPAPPPVQQAVRIVNAIDPGVTHDHLQTPAGERVILNIIGRNARAVRAALQG
ncbi:MAG: tape measure protein [Thermomonas hydrothermalis]|uniref:tape measure protein n=1 Tax=Thermomonas hydrothermalis TaxID=213588 RepID=UPI002352D438|nr:tape measure protein [Thermomonas hydrothermalis]MCL6619498.1 tape measure protein [Thermomonas hydrothermalis]